MNCSAIKYQKAIENFSSVLDDEFPRSEFHAGLRRKLKALGIKEVL
jgi:hypothetical protein